MQEARFARALSRAAAGDRAGALADLVAYVAREPRPAHLAEARALRAGLAGGEARPSPERLARIRLLEGHPDAALGALGGNCTADLPPERLRAIGVVHEYADAYAAARRCYELASAAGDQTSLARLARLDARLPDAELRTADRSTLERAAGREIPAAFWALARLDAAGGDSTAALARADRALALAARAEARRRRGGRDLAPRCSRARATAGRPRARPRSATNASAAAGSTAAAALLGIAARRADRAAPPARPHGRGGAAPLAVAVPRGRARRRRRPPRRAQAPRRRARAWSPTRAPRATTSAAR